MNSATPTMHRCVEADLAMKEKALARLDEPQTKMRRFHPSMAHMTPDALGASYKPYARRGELIIPIPHASN